MTLATVGCQRAVFSIVTRSRLLSVVDFETVIILRGLEIKFVDNYFLLSRNYVTSKGAISHNFVYYQQLSITCNQVSLTRTIIWINYQ